MVEHSAVNRVVAGSSPARGARAKEESGAAVPKLKRIRLRGQAVKTSPFHGGNTGSIPVGVISVIAYADVAQLAEQLICNQQVIGSSPIIGFYTISYCIYGQIPEWPKGTDCKSAANCFGGSNPPLPIGITFSVIAYNKIYYRGMEQSGSSPGS